MIITSNINVVPRKVQSRFGLIRISTNALASMLRLPQSFEIVSIVDDPRYNGVTIKFTSPDIKETAEGGELPTIQPGQMGWSI